MKRLNCLVRGRVQGVGFRYFVMDEAESLNLHGWVRNLPTGEVELEAEGEEDTLKLLLQRVKQGPILSRVDSVIEYWADGGLNAYTEDMYGRHSF